MLGVSFRCEPGTVTLVCGGNGAGKSTLIGLLSGMRCPQEGAVRVGGVDTREVPLRDARRLIASAPQRAHVLVATALENLRLARAELAEDEAARLADEVGLGDVSASWSKGWGTLMGPTGAKLSGGEAGRLAFARLLLSSAPVLVLDEPDASYDAPDAADMLQQLRKEAVENHRTVVLVSHHIHQAAQVADQVVCLSGGRVAKGGIGPPEEVQQRCAAYWHLLAASRGHGVSDSSLLDMDMDMTME